MPDLLLRHREVDVDRVERLERHHGLAGLEVLAEVDLPDPQDPREGRANRLPVDGGADLADLGLRLLVLGDDTVVVGLGDDALLVESVGPVEVEPREVELGLGGLQLRLLLPRVQLHENRARLDGLARLDRDPIDDARQIGAHGDALHGHGGPDGAQGLGPGLALGEDRRHGLGGGWNAAAWAAPIWICRNFTVPTAPMNTAIPTSITTMRIFMRRCLPWLRPCGCDFEMLKTLDDAALN